MDVKLLLGNLVILVAIGIAQLRLAKQLSHQQVAIAQLVTRL